MSTMKRMATGEKVFLICAFLILIIFAIIVLVPMLTVVATSFVSAQEIAKRGNFILIPQQWDFSAYRLLLGSGSSMWRAYGNTAFVVIVGTTCNLFMTILMAYPLSKKDLKGRTAILGMVFVTMLFNGGIVPNYMLVKELGLLNNLWALILPGLISAWNMLLMRNFFYSIPESLEEAAFLDGAGTLQVLLRVVLPLSLPSITTIGLFYAVGHWNAWFGGVMYLTDSKKLPVQNLLRTIVDSASAALQDADPAKVDEMEMLSTPQSIKCAAIVTGTIPILFVYPFIQKFFVKGAMVGSVKG